MMGIIMKQFLIIFASILVMINSVYAHAEIESVDSIMNQMMSNQGVSQISNIDCSKISEHEFEELGDAVMGRMTGDRELHERMDNTMGGEGSESLEQMHIMMGENWLECDGSHGMMNVDMMPMMMRMMGNYYPAYYSSYNTMLIFLIIGWFLAIGLSIYMVLIFTNVIRIEKRRGR